MQKPSPNEFTQSPLTREFLRAYCQAALTNASELVHEASLLYTHGHCARAYFLSVAAIEETGKALLAFDAQGRNLADSAVSAKLRRAMEDHSTKISAAFMGWLQASANLRNDIATVIDLSIHLKQGREPSMYTDIHPDGSNIQVPSEMVRDTAARDCIRLATDSLAHARRYVVEKEPKGKTRTEDQLFALKSGVLEKITNMEDFWWYHLAQLESGQGDFSESVIQYRTNYLLKEKLFGRPNNFDNDA